MTFLEAESTNLPNQKHYNFMACYLLSYEFLLLFLIVLYKKVHCELLSRVDKIFNYITIAVHLIEFLNN